MNAAVTRLMGVYLAAYIVWITVFNGWASLMMGDDAGLMVGWNGLAAFMASLLSVVAYVNWERS